MGGSVLGLASTKHSLPFPGKCRDVQLTLQKLRTVDNLISLIQLNRLERPLELGPILRSTAYRVLPVLQDRHQKTGKRTTGRIQRLCCNPIRQKGLLCRWTGCPGSLVFGVSAAKIGDLQN